MLSERSPRAQHWPSSPLGRVPREPCRAALRGKSSALGLLCPHHLPAIVPWVSPLDSLEQPQGAGFPDWHPSSCPAGPSSQSLSCFKLCCLSFPISSDNSCNVSLFYHPSHPRQGFPGHFSLSYFFVAIDIASPVSLVFTTLSHFHVSLIYLLFTFSSGSLVKMIKKKAPLLPLLSLDRAGP